MIGQRFYKEDYGREEDGRQTILRSHLLNVLQAFDLYFGEEDADVTVSTSSSKWETDNEATDPSFVDDER